MASCVSSSAKSLADEWEIKVQKETSSEFYYPAVFVKVFAETFYTKCYSKDVLKCALAYFSYKCARPSNFVDTTLYMESFLVLQPIIQFHNPFLYPVLCSICRSLPMLCGDGLATVDAVDKITFKVIENNNPFKKKNGK